MQTLQHIRYSVYIKVYMPSVKMSGFCDVKIKTNKVKINHVWTFSTLNVKLQSLKK